MDETSLDRLRTRYLDLIENSLVNYIHGESPLELKAAKWLAYLRHPYLSRHGPHVWPPRAQTMIGRPRLRNLRELTERAIQERIPGHFIETGVWRGGACILMRAVLAAYDVSDRRVYCADSFEGLPRPDATSYPADKGDRLFAFADLAVRVDDVRAVFERYGLLDEQVVFLKGWFKDTLPTLRGEQFALVRIDGDMYQSTTEALDNLYDGLAPGGFAIIDD